MQHFINTANWLLTRAADKSNYSLWNMTLVGAHMGLAPPYASALAAAEGVNVLIRAHNITGKERYLTEAKRDFGAFMVDTKPAGLQATKAVILYCCSS